MRPFWAIFKQYRNRDTRCPNKFCTTFRPFLTYSRLGNFGLFQTTFKSLCSELFGSPCILLPWSFQCINLWTSNPFLTSFFPWRETRLLPSLRRRSSVFLDKFLLPKRHLGEERHMRLQGRISATCRAAEFLEKIQFECKFWCE